MVKKALFDNIMKILIVKHTLTGLTLVSTEMDFDIPRGYIVKIHDITLHHRSLVEDFEGISADKLARIHTAVIKDPDDTSGISFPNNKVDHDFIMMLFTEILIVAGTAGDTIADLGTRFHEKNFTSEGLDVFTARNMRLNSDVFGTDAADITETVAECIVQYTLEKITDEMIIDLLDIL